MIGVMPKALVEREIGNIGLTKLRVVSSLHARAQGPDVRALRRFYRPHRWQRLPGGPLRGLTWAQLGEHGKVCGLLNTFGY